MESFELSLELASEILDSLEGFTGAITGSNKRWGTISIGRTNWKTSALLPKLSALPKPQLKRQVDSLTNASPKKAGKTEKKCNIENSISKKEQPMSIISPPLCANDMIKTMQDFESKKKMYYCVVCKYETPHQGTIKRHVETKHMPQTVTLNCLQCPKSFKLKQVLKKHYMDVHGLLEPAAKAMLP